MKKGSAVFLTLLVFLTAGYAVSGAVLAAQTEQVRVTETVLAGDASAAKGLELELPAHLANALYWDISVQPGSPAKTQFCWDVFKGSRREPAKEPATAQIQMSITLSEQAVGMQEHQLAEDASLFAPIYRDILAKTPEQGLYSETVNIKDYWQMYPLQADLYFLTDSRIKEYEDWAAAIEFCHQLEEYFRFPVNAGEKALVTVERGAEGRLDTLRIDCEEPKFQFWLHQVSTEEGVWFIPEMRDSEDRLWDYSQVPGGRSLYRLTTHPNKTPQMEDLVPVLALEPQEKIRQLEASPDETLVFLLTERKGELSLYILDAKSGSLVQKLELGKEENKVLYACNGFAVLEQMEKDKNELTLLKPVNGNWKLLWTEERAIQESAYGPAFAANFVLSEDGEKLAVAARTAPKLEPGRGGLGRGCAFTLEVLDKSGVLYAARYDTSLDSALPASKESLLEEYCMTYYEPGTRQTQLPQIRW